MELASVKYSTHIYIYICIQYILNSVFLKLIYWPRHEPEAVDTMQMNCIKNETFTVCHKYMASPADLKRTEFLRWVLYQQRWTPQDDQQLIHDANKKPPRSPNSIQIPKRQASFMPGAPQACIGWVGKPREFMKCRFVDVAWHSCLGFLEIAATDCGQRCHLGTTSLPQQKWNTNVSWGAHQKNIEKPSRKPLDDLYDRYPHRTAPE